MTKQLLIVLLLAGFAITAQAQIPTEMTDRFQAVLDSLAANVITNTGETIGRSFAITIPGYGSWQGASGVAGPDNNMTTNTTVGIASHSKLYTAVILLRLQELGLVSLDNPISQYITTPIANIDMTATIRQLLKHETGFFDPINDDPDTYYANIFADTEHFWTYEEIYTMVGEPFFNKGTGYHYSNTNYNLAAHIIENITGNSYAHNLHQYITTPLGLDMTFDAATDTEALDNVDESWCYVADTWWPRLGSVAAASMFRGTGSIVATPQDVVDFYQALFTTPFLSALSMEQLLDFEPATGYGLGIELGYSLWLGKDNYRHGGEYLGFGTDIAYDLETGAIFFVALNSTQTLEDVSIFYHTYLDYFPKKANDAGITKIVSPRSITCTQTVTPVVVLKNFGSSALTSVIINYQVDNGATQTHSWSGNLASGEEIEVALQGITATAGDHNLTVWTSAPNGAAEGNLYNDSRTTGLAIRQEDGLPSSFSEDFEGTSTPLKFWNPQHVISEQWGITRLTEAEGSRSLVKSNSHNENFGSESYIDLPMLHLGNGGQQLSFRYAYSAPIHTSLELNQSLEILVSADCGTTWTSLFNKEDDELSYGLTHDFSPYFSYSPHTDAEWHTETIPLDAYADSDVLLRFKEVTTAGGDLFLDDITVGSALGVADFFKNNVKVYPNPATNHITIKGLPDNTPVTLYSITGQRLQEAVRGDGSATINVSGLQPGVYLINTLYDTKKFVKL